MNIALIDMHNDTAYAVKAIQECANKGVRMATIQASLDGFLAKATDEEKLVFAMYQNQIQVLPNIF